MRGSEFAELKAFVFASLRIDTAIQLRIERGRRVAEEVDVVRPIRPRPDRRQLLAESIRAEHGGQHSAMSAKGGWADRHEPLR